MRLRSITPIFGGGTRSREIDQIDRFRVPSIRGQLRLWWRALLRDPALLNDPARLYAEESRLWGRAADAFGGRSQVEIRIEDTGASRPDDSPIVMTSATGYALFPARIEGERNKAIPRYRPGVTGKLIVSAPPAEIPALRNAIRAWLAFGGYGSRTRRGVGSLTVEDDAGEWLADAGNPTARLSRGTLRQAFTTLFGHDIFAPIAGISPAPGFPLLADAALLVGAGADSADRAWSDSLQWLRDFRQEPGFARDSGAGGKPGRSRWPEADKLRRLSSYSTGHAPRYDAVMAWPRAAFGLPIVGKFKDYGEPPPFQITWQQPDGALRDRMASPLIVKALPVVGGCFPCTLWLTRSDPPGEIVVVHPGSNPRAGMAQSAAAIGRPLSAADQVTIAGFKGFWNGTDAVSDAFQQFAMARGARRVAP